MFYKPLVQDFAFKYKYTFIGYILLIVLFFPIEGIVLPKVYGKVFDKIKSSSTFPEFWNIGKNISQQNLPGMLTILLLVWLVIIGSGGVKHHLESILVPEYFAHIREIIYEKTIYSQLNNFKDIKTGDYLSRVMELTRNIKDMFQYVITRLFPEFTVSVFIVGYLLMKNSLFGLVTLIGFVLCMIVQIIGGYYVINKVSEKEEFFNTNLSENLQDSLDNLMNVYINNELDSEIKKNNNMERVNTDMNKHIMFAENLIIFLTQIITITLYAVSIYLLYSMFVGKKINVTEGIVVLLIIGQLVSYMLNVNWGLVHHVIYKLGIVAGSRDFLNEIFSVHHHGKQTDVINEGNIEFKDVTYRYDQSNNDFLFENLNLNIPGGSKVGLIGRSGSGKSTLMKMLVGLYKPEKGEINIDGIDINDMDFKYLRNNVNYVNQKTNLFDESVIYNMLYGNDNVSEKELIEKLEQYKLLDVFSDLPNGIYANAGIHGGNLSGGMQKITLLMRGILKPGKIIILDEPLAGLDSGTRMKVMDMILAETKNKTLIVITHDKEILPSMDKVININKL